MAILEAHRVWMYAGSTGYGKAVQLSPGMRQVSVYYESSSGCTGTVQLYTRSGSSGGPYVGLGTSTSLSTGAVILHKQPLGTVNEYSGY